MNTTKWTEIFHLFYTTYECGRGLAIRWRTLDRSGHVSAWDGTWSHFLPANDSGRSIVWLQMWPPESMLAQVVQDLRAIHLPGTVENGVITIWGQRQDADWL